jgi:LysR family transcriptional regulator, glycine cleavage system transcriptional activator
MRDQMKPPNHVGLRALDAVLRLGGLSAAAREMGMTPAAVSHRIRDLEAEAGLPLVRREGGRFVATEAGQVVAGALGDAFARIRRADATVRGLTSTPQIRIVAPMSFTVLWLLPRLAAFEALHPEVTPYLSAASDPLRRDGEADIRVCHGTEPPSCKWVRIARDKTAVAGAAGTAFPNGLEQVLAGRVIHIDTPGGKAAGTVGWGDWATAQGLVAADPVGPHVSAEHIAADLAMQGKGLMLASLFTLADAILSGRLSVMPGTKVETGISYWMLVEGTVPVTRAFADWLRDMAARHEADQMVQAGR